MRTVTPQLEALLAAETTTLATCWKLTRQDSVALGFTDHDKALTVDDVTYESIAGFTPSSVESNSSMAVDNLDVEGQLFPSRITEADLLAGVYNFAEIEIFLVNYADLSQGIMWLKRGWLGEVTLKKNMFMAEIRGLAQKLNQTIGEVYSPSCRAILGDTRCKVALAGFTVAATVSTAESRQVFTAAALTQAMDWFTGGEIVWTSGNNEGLRMEIKEFANTQVVLSLPMPGTIQPGDSFNIIAGCDKSFTTCQTKFDNVLNFRGEPYVPGMDAIMQTAGTI